MWLCVSKYVPVSVLIFLGIFCGGFEALAQNGSIYGRSGSSGGMVEHAHNRTKLPKDFNVKANDGNSGGLHAERRVLHDGTVIESKKDAYPNIVVDSAESARRILERQSSVDLLVRPRYENIEDMNKHRNY